MRLALACVLTVCICFLSGCTGDPGSKTDTKNVTPPASNTGGKSGQGKEPTAPTKD